MSESAFEIWFDKNELRGGDAWDRQIRKQIHECGLFVPIVSATTEARLGVPLISVPKVPVLCLRKNRQKCWARR